LTVAFLLIIDSPLSPNLDSLAKQCRFCVRRCCVLLL
jgi:hypothetical protein